MEDGGRVKPGASRSKPGSLCLPGFLEVFLSSSSLWCGLTHPLLQTRCIKELIWPTPLLCMESQWLLPSWAEVRIICHLPVGAVTRTPKLLRASDPQQGSEEAGAWGQRWLRWWLEAELGDWGAGKALSGEDWPGSSSKSKMKLVCSWGPGQYRKPRDSAGNPGFHTW